MAQNCSASYGLETRHHELDGVDILAFSCHHRETDAMFRDIGVAAVPPVVVSYSSAKCGEIAMAPLAVLTAQSYSRVECATSAERGRL